MFRSIIDYPNSDKIIEHNAHILFSYRNRELTKTSYPIKKMIKRKDFTYFFKTPNDLVKIGKSNRVKDRFKEAETLHYDIELLGVVNIPEHTVHVVFNDFRLSKKREWFRYTDSMLDYIRVNRVENINSW